MTLTLDRLDDGGWAVFELETGASLTLPAALLPENSEAGDVFTLETARSEAVGVLVLRRDPARGRARREEALGRLSRLRRRDPGGDLEL